MTTTNSKQIAALNDQFRKQGASENIRGRRLATAGISALPMEEQLLIWGRVRYFDAFDEGNDPYCEHDFGSINSPCAGKVFWKIDYYADSDMDGGSEHPEDAAQSFRVLTVMLAVEY